AKQPFGPPALSLAPTPPIAGPQSRASSMPIRSQPACARSWPSAVRGQAAPPIFCGPAPVAAVRAVRQTAPAGPAIPASSLAACVARKTFLRALGIDIAFSREGRAGSRIIRIRVTQENTVSTVSSVCDQPAPRPAGDVCDDASRSDSVGRYPMGLACITTADDADGADANAGLHFG